MTGNVNYEAENHQHMIDQRAKKVSLVADDVPLQEVQGPESGKLLVMSWGGTYGAVATAVRKSIEKGHSVAHCHLRYLNPFLRYLVGIIGKYEKVLIPELNKGQLRMLIRGTYLADAIGLNKVQGKPFAVQEVFDKI